MQIHYNMKRYRQSYTPSFEWISWLEFEEQKSDHKNVDIGRSAYIIHFSQRTKTSNVVPYFNGLAQKKN